VHRPLRSSPAVESARAIIRRRVKRLVDDRPLAPDIEAIRHLILGGAFRPLVQAQG
jgi:histidine ammonia-lyase